MLPDKDKVLTIIKSMNRIKELFETHHEDHFRPKRWQVARSARHGTTRRTYSHTEASLSLSTLRFWQTFDQDSLLIVASQPLTGYSAKTTNAEDLQNAGRSPLSKYKNGDQVVDWQKEPKCRTRC